MSIQTVPSVRPRAVSPLDRAAVALLRLVMMEGWRPEPAARVLRRRVRNDQRLLRLLYAHVVRGMLDKPTRIDQRARATLERALSDDDRALAIRDSALAGARR